ncbi:MAG: hypothetical protein JWQ19_4016 [Subtercola sp.]|nr:hypothetical protein [Subtercola sp.]
MPLTVFFSWQSDTGGAEQELIERALNDALDRIVADATVEPAVRQEGLAVDRDTKGIGGTPPIVDTIFSKIDGAAIFVPDLTFVSTRTGGRPAPNPNVLIEYGWALKSLSHARMAPVMNSHHGKPTPETMPFDMRHLKFPIEFDLSPGANAVMEQEVRDKLSRDLEENLRAIIGAPDFPVSLQSTAPFPTQNALSRFRMEGPIGKTYDNFGIAPQDVRLQDAASFWLHLRPEKDSGKRWSTSELKALATAPKVSLMPLAAIGSTVSLDWVRGEDGFGVFVTMGKGAPTLSTAYIFETGEIWSIDAYHASAQNAIHMPIDACVRALDLYRALLKDRLGIDPPYHLDIGVDRVKDEKIWLPTRPGHIRFENPVGACISNEVTYGATISAGTDSRTALRPFFEKLLDKCGVESPELIEFLFPPSEKPSNKAAVAPI